MSLLANRDDSLLDWILPVIGGLFIVVAVATLLSQDKPLLENLLQVALPLVAGLSFLILAPRFRRLDLDGSYKAEILWTGALAGLIVGGALLWQNVFVLADGTDVLVGERIGVVTNGLAIGFLIGGFAGYYRARTKQQIQDVADAGRDFLEVFEKADVGIVLLDPETGTIARANPRYAELTGTDSADLEGMPISEVSGNNPDFDLAYARQFIEKTLDGKPQRFDWVIQRNDGSEFWAEVSLTHASIGGNSRLLAFVRDVGDRKRREQEREKYREIYEKADYAVGLTDPETGTIVEANPRYSEILGYDPAELEGKSIESISADSPEFNQENAMQVIGDAMAGEPQTLDWLLERRDGSTVWVGVSLQRTTIGDEDRLLAFFADATERKEGEQELVRHRSQMEFFNSLLRHDVLNGITVIRTHAAKLAEQLEGQEKGYAETIVEWSDNTTGVVGRVRDVLDTLTGEAEPDLHKVNLSVSVRDAVDRLQTTYPGVTFETDVADGVTVVATEMLDDVLSNLLTNAVDHNDSEDLTVSTTVERGDDTATVRIADDGVGLTEDDKAAVFRRHETGHVKKTGSGFGLYFVDAMVSTYGGEVSVEDNRSGGATFVLELPAP